MSEFSPGPSSVEVSPELIPRLVEGQQATSLVHEQEVAQETSPHELRVRHETFEQAQEAEKKFSDTFIDNVLTAETGDLLPFTVGTERVGLKGYLDKVEATDTDKAILSDPEAIAAVYLNTTEMIARNLKIKVAKGLPPDRIQEIAGAKESYMSSLKDEAEATADKIVDWCEAADQKKSPRPGEAFGYYGFKVGDTDVLAWGEKGASDFHPNIKVQRQGGGNFIFGYSDARISQRMDGNRDTLDQRIYLNPDIMASPEIFEKVLGAANEAGIPLELKMLQRAEELGSAHIVKSRNPKNGDALRGDGIVIYTASESADDVLALALAAAKDNAEAFSGRETSRIPQTVADGIAIGSEPVQAPGKDAESLTSHRTKVIEKVAGIVAKSGKTGQEARDAFRRGMEYYSKRGGLNPNNIAFNERSRTVDYDKESKEAGWDSPQRVQRLVEQYVLPGSKVLDIGTGTGLAVKGYAEKGATIIGLDHDTDMLDRARKVVGDKGVLRHADINKLLPVDDLQGQIDVVQAVGVLEFADNLEKVFAQANIAQKKGGVFAFTSEALAKTGPQSEATTAFPEAGVTVHRRSVAEITKLLHDSGYTLVSHDIYDAYERGDSVVKYNMFLAQKT